MSHENSAIPLPWVSRLAKLNGKGRGKVVRLQQRLSKIWWLTYGNKSEKRSNGTVEKLEVIKKWSWNCLRTNITQNRVHFPDSTEKRPSQLHTRLMRFNSDLVSSYLQPDINKFPSAHNRGHVFWKFKTLQGCTNLAHHKLSWSTKDIPSPRKTRSVSESRFTRHFDNGKTKPAKPPDVPNNPDRSCTYLVLRAHQMNTTYN